MCVYRQTCKSEALCNVVHLTQVETIYFGLFPVSFLIQFFYSHNYLILFHGKLEGLLLSVTYTLALYLNYCAWLCTQIFDWAMFEYAHYDVMQSSKIKPVFYDMAPGSCIIKYFTALVI